MATKNKYRINNRMIWLGIISFAGFMYATTYAHEAGHLFVCKSSGFEGMIVVQPYTFETRMALCYGTPGNHLLYWSFGGIIGMIAAGIPFAIFRKYKFIVIGTVPHIVANAITGSMETFAHDWYIHTPDIPMAIASIPMMAVMTVLLFRYSFVRVDSSIQPQY